MRAYDNNNYYGYNNNSMTPSSSSNESQISHGGGGHEYLSNISTTPQSSDAEMNYHTSTTLRRPRSDKNQRVSSGSFTIIGSNNDDELQNDSTSYGGKINLQIPTLDATTPTPQFRIQQGKRSHRKNTSFSIMTELPPTSRTPSPPILSNTSTSGRVSPFRGRGFRPGASSRHTTPSSSPPPPILPSDISNNNNNNITSGMATQPYYEDQASIRNINYINSVGNDSKQDSSTYRQQSRIPRTNRIDNRKQNEIQDKLLLHTNEFSINQATNHSTLTNNSLSQSLSNLPVKPGISRPPPSPRRNGTKQAFTQLSPIIGTPKMSPDTTSPPTKSILKPSKSAFVLITKDETSSVDSKTKSPSKIPRSTSLNRLSKSIESLSKEPTLRENSRNSTTKSSQSRLQSRETSPNLKPPTGTRRAISKNIPKSTLTAKSTNISRTSSMKNLSKPNSRAPSRSTSPINMQTTGSSSPNKINRLAPKQVNRGTSRSRSPSTNPTSRSSSPNKSKKPITKSTIARGSNSLHPSRSTSPAVNRTSNSTSRGPSPNRLAVQRERIGVKSRDSSPNKNKKSTPKSPTRIPIKSNNNYKNVISKIDSNNKRATNVTNKPKIPQKPSIDSDNNHKSKTRESRLSRQMSKDKNIGKPNVNEKSKKLLKSSSSKKLISIPGENVTNSDTKASSIQTHKADNDEVSKHEQDNTTTSEENETETINNDESEDGETKPTPTLATLIAKNFDTNANNVVSVTTETATAPLNIEAPKPQIPVAPIENLLSKSVAEKPSIGDVKQTSLSNVLTNIQNKSKNDKTVPSSQEDGSKSPPKPIKSQSKPTNSSETTNNTASVSDSLKQSAAKQNESNLVNSNKESNQNTKMESKILSKKNSEKNIETSNVNNNNTTVITHSNSVDKNSILNLTNSLQTNANNNTKNMPIIVSDKVKPIQIQVKEKGMNLDVQSGNIERRPSNGTIAGKAEPRLPSSNATHNADSTTEDENNKKSFCGRMFSCCKFPACCSRCRKNTSDMDSRQSNAKVSPGFLSCCRKTSEDVSVESEPIVADHRRSDVSDRSQGHTSSNSDQRTCCMKFKDVICCSRKNKVSDLSNQPKGCCGSFSWCRRKSNEENWAERRDSILSDAPPRKCCPGSCWPFCRRKSQDPSTEPDSRRTSMLDKKKSLSPSTIQPPAEKRKPALDESLVEHTSEMRGAIPVLPVPLAWICLILNCILPGVGTTLSGIFCLCFGKPRFSVHDGARARLGSFIINLIVGVAQLFCVLFCLVGWGWSIWWGVIMLKVARKHKKMKANEADIEENERVPTATNVNHNGPGVERGRS